MPAQQPQCVSPQDPQKPTHTLHTHHARQEASRANLSGRGDAPQSQTMHWSGIKSLSFISCGAGCERKHMSATRTGHTGPASSPCPSSCAYVCTGMRVCALCMHPCVYICILAKQSSPCPSSSVVSATVGCVGTEGTGVCLCVYVQECCRVSMCASESV